MNYNVIVGMCKNRGIGINNTLPWNIKEDLRLFSKLTKGDGNNAIIMGKNTWESLPKQPLPGRDNLILSTTLDINKNTPKNNCIKSFNNVEEILLFCRKQNYQTIWIIGGEKIYTDFLRLDIISNIFVSYINKEYSCDKFFPELDEDKWSIIERKSIENTQNIDLYQVIYQNMDYR